MYRYIAKLDYLGSMNGPCYIQNRAVMNRVIKRSSCIYKEKTGPFFFPNLSVPQLFPTGFRPSSWPSALVLLLGSALNKSITSPLSGFKEHMRDSLKMTKYDYRKFKL